VVQFGSTDTLKMKKWSAGVKDEEVLLGNKKGTISFARLGKDSRSADLFINLKDNTRLDTITFGHHHV
jgi:cyclophilin family peptidyl-prolyl cis-trans isomerase